MINNPDKIKIINCHEGQESEYVEGDNILTNSMNKEEKDVYR